MARLKTKETTPPQTKKQNKQTNTCQTSRQTLFTMKFKHMYPKVKFYLVKSGGLTCAMKIYMRNRTCSPVFLSLNFGILCRPLAAKMQKWNQSWLRADLIFIPWWCAGLACFLPFQIFFLFPPPETWWTSVNSGSQAPTPGVHAEDTRAGASAAGQPPSHSPRHKRHLPSTILLLLCFTRVSGIWPWCFRCPWSWPQGLT